jgi:hypothetical protein
VDFANFHHAALQLLSEHHVAVHRFRCYLRNLRGLKLHKGVALGPSTLLIARQAQPRDVSKLSKETCKTRSQRDGEIQGATSSPVSFTEIEAKLRPV